MNNKKYTIKELDDMRCEIWSHRLNLLGEDIDVVDYFDKVFELRDEVLNTSDEEVIKEYNKLLN